MLDSKDTVDRLMNEREVATVLNVSVRNGAALATFRAGPEVHQDRCGGSVPTAGCDLMA
jgi:hypothetical protein